MEKSQSVKEIGKALSLFQTKMEKIKKDSLNPFFGKKYASLSTILESIQLPLAECNLIFSQIPDGDCLTTILIHHESGEYLQACYAIHPAKVDPQGIGSAITYARRYALSAILGLNVDEDDDGNASSSQNGSKVTPNKRVDESELEWLNENDEKFTKAKEFIKQGGKIGDIRKKYKISKKVETLLTAN